MRLSFPLFAAGCAALVLTGCGTAMPASTPTKTAQPIVTYAPWLRSVSGDVTIKRNGVSSPATKKANLQAGDEIITQATSTADIIWPKYGHTLIDSNSTLDLSTSVDSGKSITEKLTLVSGRIWTRLQKTIGGDSYFGVIASNVSSVVRGTSFGVGLSSDGVTIKVTDSTVNVSIGNGNPTPVQELTKTIVHPTDTQVPAPTVMSVDDKADPFLLEGDTLLSDEELHATSSDALPVSPPVSITWNQPQACPQYGAPNNCYGTNDQTCGGYDKWAASCATFVWNINPCAAGQNVVGYTSATCSYETGVAPQGSAKATVENGKLTIDCTEFAKQFKTDACTCNNGITLHAVVQCQ